MADRSSRGSSSHRSPRRNGTSPSRRGSYDSRGSSGYRSSRESRPSSQPTPLGQPSRRRNMGSIGDERRPQRRGLASTDRSTSDVPQTRNRKRQRQTAPNGGYALKNRPINFSGKGSYDPRIIVVGGVGIALVILIVFILASCVSSCGASNVDPTENVSPTIEGDLRTQVESLVTSDYQSTYVAEHADRYPTELIQLMVSEPASTSFVFNYPNASHEGKPYEESVTRGKAPLLYDFDQRWGYVDYAGSLLGVTGSGPTTLAMARMGLLGSTDLTPANVAQIVTQLGGASGDSGMSPSLFGTTSADTTTTHTDEDGDGVDDVTGETIDQSQGQDQGQGQTQGTGQDLASALGLKAEVINIEPGYSITESVSSVLSAGGFVAIETAGGTLGASSHWVLVVQVNNDGTMTIYDPTSTVNSTHLWASVTVVSDAKTLVSLKDPNVTTHVDADGDGYDDVTGEYIESSDNGSTDGDANGDGSGEGEGDTDTYE